MITTDENLEDAEDGAIEVHETHGPVHAESMSSVTRHVFEVLFGFTGIWTFLVCTIIIITVRWGVHRQTRKSSKLLVSLSLTGIIVSLLVIPWEVFGPLLPTKHYKASYWLCKLTSYAAASGLAANELSEYLVVLDEISTNIRLKIPDVPQNRITLALVIVWLFSFIYNTHIFFTHGYDPDLIKSDLCGPFVGALEVQAFFVVDTLIFFFIPAFIWGLLLMRVRHHINYELSHNNEKYHAAQHCLIVLSFTFAALIICQFPLVILSYFEEFRPHGESGSIAVYIAIAKLLSYNFNWLSPAVSALTRPDVLNAMISIICCRKQEKGKIDNIVGIVSKPGLLPIPQSYDTTKKRGSDADLTAANDDGDGLDNDAAEIDLDQSEACITSRAAAEQAKDSFTS